MKKKLHIQGMHCVSCEILLEKEFKKIPGLRTCKVSHKHGNAEIDCEDSVPMEKFEKIVHDSGYKLLEEPPDSDRVKKAKEEREKPDYLQIVLIAIGLGAIFFVLQRADVMRFFPNFGSQVNVFIALLMGVVASLSTCLALTGGIVMSFGAMVHVHEGKEPSLLARALPHIYFHIGRVGGFVLLGGLLGLLGSKIDYSLNFTGYLTILIAIVMFYVGLQILNIVPNITKLGFHLPKSLSGKIDSLQSNDHHLMPMLIGVMTFFLPCGFTQTMQLAAVASQDLFTGSMIMGAFAIGTMPVLLSVGIGSTYAHQAKMQFFYKFIGVIIVFFGLYSFNSGLVLAGSPVTIDFWDRGNATDSVVSGDVQVVKMDVDWSFKPNEFKVRKGVPVRWEINGINISGCSNEIVIPSLNIRKKLEQGLNIVEFTPEKEGVIPFSCWMGMLNGRFIVGDSKGNIGASILQEVNQPLPSGACGGGQGCGCGGGGV